VKLALRILAVVAFATQAVAFDGGRFVCRMTGEVMSSPCCPDEVADESDSPALEDAPCCVLQAAHTAMVAVAPAEQGNVRGPLTFPVTPAIGMASAPAPSPDVEVGVRTVDPPRRVRLHLQVRQLLI
jgi:hypothetical protein